MMLPWPSGRDKAVEAPIEKGCASHRAVERVVTSQLKYASKRFA